MMTMPNPRSSMSVSRSIDPAPRLIFTPLAWLKLQYLCHAGPTEVAAFGLAAKDDLLTLEDILIVRQRCTPVTVAFDDEAVADLFDRMVDAGIAPERFARVWLHTHPGASVEPSSVDEETFHRVFGGCDWAVMAILGRTGNTFARLRFNAGPGGSLNLPVTVDWTNWPEDSVTLPEGLRQWEQEYAERVEPWVGHHWANSFGHRDDWHGGEVAGRDAPPRRFADMTDVEFARFESGMPLTPVPVFGDVDPVAGEVLAEDAEFYDFDIFT